MPTYPFPQDVPPVSAGWRLSLSVLLLFLLGCQAPQADQELAKELGALRNEVAQLKEKVAKLEAEHELLRELFKASQASRSQAAPVEAAPASPPAPAETPAAPGGAKPLSVDELLKNKDQLLGTRVTVRGLPGPVLVHKKSLFLTGAGGMVEVLFGNLQDKAQVDRLTAQTLETPLTVSGMLSGAPGQGRGAARLVIMADTVEF